MDDLLREGLPVTEKVKKVLTPEELAIRKAKQTEYHKKYNAKNTEKIKEYHQAYNAARTEAHKADREAAKAEEALNTPEA